MLSDSGMNPTDRADSREHNNLFVMVIFFISSRLSDIGHITQNGISFICDYLTPSFGRKTRCFYSVEEAETYMTMLGYSRK